MTILPMLLLKPKTMNKLSYLFLLFFREKTRVVKVTTFNPKARQDQIIDGFPFFFNEKKKVMRFSVGRTF